MITNNNIAEEIYNCIIEIIIFFMTAFALHLDNVVIKIIILPTFLFIMKHYELNHITLVSVIYTFSKGFPATS